MSVDEIELERCRQRKRQLGAREYNRRLALHSEAQQLCHSLCLLHKRTPRVERLLLMAEDRRERRGQTIWPWCTYIPRGGEREVKGGKSDGG